jgi:glycosyltransferase involved in cell wall biosynthesis
MKIGIVNMQAPLVWGGAEYLAESLQIKLAERGHQAEIIRIPFKWYPPQAVLDHMLACRLLRLDAGDPDLLIAMKFPAYLAPFRRKKLWLVHQFRQVYDLWGTPYQDIPDTPEGRRVREMVIRADKRYLPEAEAIYTNSRIVADRLKTFTGIEADGVLYPPLRHPELFRPGPSGDYFFYPSRLVTSKRQSIAIEAMRLVRAPFKLVLAGLPDTPTYGDELANAIRRHGLEDRVHLAGWVSEEQKADLMANCLAALYLAYDEDSYGFVTLEAFQSRKAVITFQDSGGVHELVEHKRNGLIVDPTPESLAEAMETLWAARRQAINLGKEAYASLARLGISWDHALDRLLA